jgi:secondary thiamine-phosphate synthase enzyme
VAVDTSFIALSTQGDGDTIDITAQVQAVVDEYGSTEGFVNVFVQGSTAALTTMEFEPGGVADLKALLDRLVPAEGDYEHNRLNNDSNSHAHQRASVIGPSEVVPLVDARLALGTWQQLVLIDFDDRPRQRTVIVSVVS